MRLYDRLQEKQARRILQARRSRRRYLLSLVFGVIVSIIVLVMIFIISAEIIKETMPTIDFYPNPDLGAPLNIYAVGLWISIGLIVAILYFLLQRGPHIEK